MSKKSLHIFGFLMLLFIGNACQEEQVPTPEKEESKASISLINTEETNHIFENSIVTTRSNDNPATTIENLWILEFSTTSNDGVLIVKEYLDQIHRNSFNSDLIKGPEQGSKYALYLVANAGPDFGLNLSLNSTTTYDFIRSQVKTYNEDVSDNNFLSSDWIEITPETSTSHIGRPSDNKIEMTRNPRAKLSIDITLRDTEKYSIESVRLLHIPEKYSIYGQSDLENIQYTDIDLTGQSLSNILLPPNLKGVLSARPEGYKIEDKYLNAPTNATTVEVVIKNSDDYTSTYLLPLGADNTTDYNVCAGHHYTLKLTQNQFAVFQPNEQPDFVRFYGKDWINIGFAPTDNMVFRIKASVSDVTKTNNLFGIRVNENNNCGISYNVNKYWQGFIGNRNNLSSVLKDANQIINFELTNQSLTIQEDADGAKPETIINNGSSYGNITQALQLGKINRTNNEYFNGDIYSFQCLMQDTWKWKEYSPVVSLVPSYDENGKVGFRDELTQIFYPKTTEAAPAPLPIPEPEENNKYVYFDGSHYIDLGFIAEDDMEFVVCCELERTDARCLFGVRQRSNKSTYDGGGRCLLATAGSGDMRLHLNNLGYISLGNVSSLINTRLTYRITVNSAEKLDDFYEKISVYDPSVKRTETPKTVSNTSYGSSLHNKNIFLGAMNEVYSKTPAESGADQFFVGKMAYFLVFKKSGNTHTLFKCYIPYKQPGETNYSTFIEELSGEICVMKTKL